MSVKSAAYFLIYVLIFFFTLVAVIVWDRRKRRTRRPFPEDLKLLRMPGERLWRGVIEKDEAQTLWYLLAMLVPLLVATCLLQIVAHFFQDSPTGMVVTVVVFAFSLLLAVRACQRQLQKRANDYLGFFG